MAVGLVACCGPKLERAAPARDLYQSDLFRKSAAYLERRGITEWAILSAEHGLVLLDQVIEPYDKTLSKMSKSDRVAWAVRAGDQVMKQFAPKTKFVILAGKLYLAAIPMGCGYEVEDPLKGMQIGERLKFLKAEINAIEHGKGNCCCPERTPRMGWKACGKCKCCVEDLV